MSKLSSFVRSIRFRLSMMYSSVVFGLGAAVLGITYYFVRRGLRRLPLVFDSRLAIVNGRPILIQNIDLDTAELVEQAITQRALSILSDYLWIGLVALFLLSLVVGWIVAGRASAPSTRSPPSPADPASDLRRIGYQGPDDEPAGWLPPSIRCWSASTPLSGAAPLPRRHVPRPADASRHPLQRDVLVDDPDATVEDWRRPPPSSSATPSGWAR